MLDTIRRIRLDFHDGGQPETYDVPASQVDAEVASWADAPFDPPVTVEVIDLVSDEVRP